MILDFLNTSLPFFKLSFSIRSISKKGKELEFVIEGGIDSVC